MITIMATTIATTTKSSKRQSLEGLVVSHKCDKTALVLVTRFVKHQKYGKFVKRTKRYKAHDEKNVYVVGDKVRIDACRPVSKDKHFVVVAKIGKGLVDMTIAGDADAVIAKKSSAV